MQAMSNHEHRAFAEPLADALLNALIRVVVDIG
jgi:hypothetical protein